MRIRRPLLTAALTATTLVLSTLVAGPAHAADPIYDPVVEMPEQSRLGLVLEEYAQFPQTFTNPPLIDQRLNRIARINTIMELPDGSGRRAVPDLNGKLYIVKNGIPSVYLDVAAMFAPQFFSGRGLGQGFGYVTFHPDFKRNGKFYTIHTEQASLTTEVPDWSQTNTLFHGVISEFTATDPAADVFAGTRREVLRIGFGGQIHGIQEINFNPTARRGDRDYGQPLPRGRRRRARRAQHRPAEPGDPARQAPADRPAGHERGQRAVRDPAREPVRRPGRASSARSTPTASGTRTGSAGTGRPAGSTSATSASTPSRRSTRCGPATTSAGACARARSSST